MEEITVEVELRAGRPDDAQACGRIAYDAFKAIADEHNFPPDFPSPEHAITVLSFLMAHPHFHKVVAEFDGRIVGSNFLDERNSIAGIGPITVDPTVQNRAIGRRLMQAVMERTAARNSPGVRLVHVHPDPDELGRVYQADVPINAAVPAACGVYRAPTASMTSRMIRSAA